MIKIETTKIYKVLLFISLFSIYLDTCSMENSLPINTQDDDSIELNLDQIIDQFKAKTLPLSTDKLIESMNRMIDSDKICDDLHKVLFTVLFETLVKRTDIIEQSLMKLLIRACEKNKEEYFKLLSNREFSEKEILEILNFLLQRKSEYIFIFLEHNKQFDILLKILEDRQNNLFSKLSDLEIKEKIVIKNIENKFKTVNNHLVLTFKLLCQD